ncbi:MAG: hypothetical protein ACTSU7_00975 [Candidatus Heimdallarchaeaceae archaeon]
MVTEDKAYPVSQVNKIRKENMKGLPTSGIVEVKLKNPKKSTGIVIRTYGSGNSKRLFLTPDGFERKYKLDGHIKLNMENEEDRLLYGQILHHPVYVAKGIYEIFDSESESESFLAWKKLEKECADIIMDLSAKDTKDLCRILLIKVRDGSSENVLKKLLFDYVEENPKLFLDEYNSSDKPYKILLRSLMDRGHCEQKNGRFLLMNQSIGTTFEQGVDWLKLDENKDLLPQYRKLLKEGA